MQNIRHPVYQFEPAGPVYCKHTDLIESRFKHFFFYLELVACKINIYLILKPYPDIRSVPGINRKTVYFRPYRTCSAFIPLNLSQKKLFIKKSIVRTYDKAISLQIIAFVLSLSCNSIQPVIKTSIILAANSQTLILSCSTDTFVMNSYIRGVEFYSNRNCAVA